MIQEAEVVADRRVEPMVIQPVEIRRILWETDDTFTLLLEVDHVAGPYAFKPGQFNMVYVYGVGEAAISISSDPGKPAVIAHTIHRVGTVTSALAQHRKGDIVGIRGPFGSSWPIDNTREKDICIVAGGIGLAPLRPVMYEMLRRRSEFGRIILLYGARSPLDLLYRVELEQWGKLHNVEVIVTVDRGDSSWKGYIGVVTHLFSYLKLDARETMAFVCGPETMMKYTLDELDKRGIPPEQVYLSLERNMKCAVGFCGHCQFGPIFICKDGPVFPLPVVQALLDRKEM
ncbi:MAG: FAD/NAD(P)-binding protein [Bacteroidota bacterium]